MSDGTSHIGRLVEVDGPRLIIENADKKKEIIIKDLSFEDIEIVRSHLLKNDQDENTVDIPMVRKNYSSRPDELVSFLKIINEHTLNYSKADNALKKSLVRTERAKALSAGFKGADFNGWPGVISHLSTNQNRAAVISVTIDVPNIKIQNTQNPVKHGSKLYMNIASFKDGDKIYISGQFLHSNDDHFKEISFTEEGSMMAPEFEIIIAEVRKAESN